MDKLIEALQIFLTYGNLEYPINCEHNVLYVFIDPKVVSDEDAEKLGDLSFFAAEETPGCFCSTHYGSA